MYSNKIYVIVEGTAYQINGEKGNKITFDANGMTISTSADDQIDITGDEVRYSYYEMWAKMNADYLIEQAQQGEIYEEKTVTATTSQQVINPTEGKTITKITVNAVTAAIDSNIVAGNIKKDIEILGVTGTYEGEPASE